MELTYKGKPLVRNGKKIYYGNAYEKYILVLTILATKEEDGAELPSRVVVQIQDTDPNLMFKPEQIVKQTEKPSLAEALEIGVSWLECM